MWVFLNNAFLSIVAHGQNEDLFCVRARFEGDIEAVFPEADVAETPRSDYRFSASISRHRVVERVAQITSEINYPSFKDSVRDPNRKDAYIQVWEAMWSAQQLRKR